MKRLCKGLGKSLIRGLLGDLLWRRFSPLRSAMMPVRVLEPAAKSGKKARPNCRFEVAERKKMLKKSGLGYCFFLSFWGIALEITLLIGEILFVITMTELIRKGFISSLGSSLQDAEIYIFAAWCFNYMLVETIYVCMGFSLYINSRIEVEGWDIEITFRTFAEKLKTKSMNGALIVFTLVCLFLPVKSFATDRELIAAPEDVPLEKLQEIFDSSDFGGEKDSWGIRLKNPRQQRDFPDLSPMLEKLRQIFASVLRLILIALIAGLVVFLIFYLRKFRRGRSGGIDGPVMKILPEKNMESPESLLDKALGFFEQGNIRMAWGYCTAAAILSWPLYRGLVFPPNATESDCANMVNSMAANNTAVESAPPSCNIDEARAFGDLIKNWVNFAYAGRLPSAGSFEEAAALCKRLRTANG